MIDQSDQMFQNDELVRANAIHVFTYLKELAQLRTKVVRDCLDYEDLIWFSDIPKEQGCYTIAWGTKTEEHDDVWIEVRKLKKRWGQIFILDFVLPSHNWCLVLKLGRRFY